ncbi:MAG: hypothetical protein GY752_07295 [bacterium]|nr:hypothetical protein [bacterium]MCP4799575.1 hypothetical protein [bacterium]
MRFITSILLVGIALLSGCGIYSASSGRVDDSIKQVSIPYLVNETAEPGIGIELTDAIIQAIQADNTLKIVDDAISSSDITGRVVRYKLKEAFTTSDLKVDEYQVQILVELSMRVKSDDSYLFENKKIAGTGNYILDDPDGTSEQTARVEAAGEIVREILATIVEDW